MTRSTGLAKAYRGEVSATFTLAVPLALTQLVQMAMGFVDVVMIGRLGPTSMAAGVIGTSTYFTLMLICMGVVMAVSPSVAQAVGSGNDAGVGRAVRQGLWLGTLLTIPAVIVFLHAERLLLLLQQEPEVAYLAGGYIGAILWGALPNLWYTSLRGFAEGIAKPRPILIVTIGGAGLNAFLNWVLMYGNLGMPALGLVGTGYASAIVMWVLFGGMFVVTRFHTSFRRFAVFHTIRRPDPVALRELFRIGWPIGVAFGLESGLFLGAAILMGLVGTVELAAHQIALNASGVTFMIPLGIAMATTVRVGHAAGSGRRLRTELAGWAGVGLGAVVMLLPAMIFWFLPEWVVWVYTGSTDGGAAGIEVARQAASLLGIAAVFQIFDGVQVTAGGALRGLKETRAPMVVGLVTYWGMGFTLAYLLGLVLGVGAEGVWWGLTLGLAAAAIGLTIWFRHRVRRASLAVPSAATT